MKKVLTLSQINEEAKAMRQQLDWIMSDEFGAYWYEASDEELEKFSDSNPEHIRISTAISNLDIMRKETIDMYFNLDKDIKL